MRFHDRQFRYLGVAWGWRNGLCCSASFADAFLESTLSNVLSNGQWLSGPRGFYYIDVIRHVDTSDLADLL